MREPSPAYSLDQLAHRVRATVVAVRDDDLVGQRLCEMGLIPGAIVEILRAAPLGDPLEIIVEGYHLSLRRAEAAYITVRLCG